MPTFRRFKIWIKMVFGKSDLHLRQNVGNFFDCSHIKGYYNDLTGKVISDKKNINTTDYIPIFRNDYNEPVKFPIMIIQYGLGCIDMFYKTGNRKFIKKAQVCAEYIYSQVREDGSIPCMFFVKGLKNVNSSMCQGEAISLFSRVGLLTNESKYLNICDKLFEFLVDTSTINFVSKKATKGLLFYEYPDKSLVFNGYIFSLFGIYDYYLLKKDLNAKTIFDNSIDELELILGKFTYGKWSYYDLDKNLSSKFYHSLHISLLEALSNISGKDFSEYINNFKRGLNSFYIRTKMFWKKGLQKIKE